MFFLKHFSKKKRYYKKILNRNDLNRNDVNRAVTLHSKIHLIRKNHGECCKMKWNKDFLPKSNKSVSDQKATNLL